MQLLGECGKRWGNVGRDAIMPALRDEDEEVRAMASWALAQVDSSS